MLAVISGMAVLMIKILFILLSYQLFRAINWRVFFVEEPEFYGFWFSILLSIAMGYLLSSFFIEIIAVVQQFIQNLII